MRFERGKVYRIELFRDGESLGDKDTFSDLKKLYRNNAGLHVGRSAMKSAAVKIDGHKYQAKRVWTGLFA